jgi:hypothetical protein
MTNRHLGIILACVALAAALVACTLSFNEDVGTAVSDAGSAVASPDVLTGSAPSVRIVEPGDGAVVPVNQRLDLTVETDSTATRFQLNAEGRVASTIAMPPDQSGPTSAILSWQPPRAGSYRLEVVAFNGNLPSAPAAIQIEASGLVSAPTGGQGTCTGRVLVSQLNYRSGPTTSATRLGKFDVGETVTVIGRNEPSTWYHVQRANAQQVWVIDNRQWFEVEGACDTLPVAE